MENSKPIVVCSICGQPNTLNNAFCSKCRSRLPHTNVNKCEARYANRSAWRTSPSIRSLLILTAGIGLGGWLLYINFAPPQLFSPPFSNINSVSSISDWTVSQRNPNRNAFAISHFNLPRGKLKWLHETDGHIVSQPILADNMLYVVTAEGGLLALNATEGDIAWERYAGAPIRISPAVAGDLVFLGLQDGRVLSLNRWTGDTLWDFNTNNPVFSSPVVSDGVLYIGSNDWRLYALDAVTGEQRWSFKADNVISSNPAVHPPVVAFTDITGKLYILDISTGKRRFDYKAVRTADGGAVFDSGRVYVADGGGRVRAVDWTQREFPFEKNLRWFQFQLYHFGLIDNVSQQKGYVWFFLERGGKFVTTPVVAKGKVYAASLSGTLFALAEDTGEKIWEFKADAPFEGSPSIVNDTLFVGDTGGRLYAIDTTTGKRKWDLGIESPITSTPVVVNSVLYLTSQDGTIYAFE